MTTDITELAQREKFEAWWERTQHNGNPPRFGWSHWRDGEGYKVDDDDSELDGMWSAWKAAGAELVEALEKAQQRITQMESRTVTDWIEHDGKWRPDSLSTDELVYLKTRKQELKIPYPAGKVMGWMHTGGDMDVMAYKLASPQARTVTPVTYSENADADRCRKWAWEQVKAEVSTEDWTTGDNITYFGFFCWGWDMRRQYNEQRPVTVKLPDDEDGQAYGFGKWANGKLPATAGTMTIAYCEDAWRAAFEVFSSAAGIKVEAE